MQFHSICLVFACVALCQNVFTQEIEEDHSYGHQIESPRRPIHHDPVPPSYSNNKVEFNCSGLQDGNYPDPHGSPSHCNTFYYSCIRFNALKIDCPHDLYFDPDNNWCESKENVVVCGGQKPTTMPPADVPILHPSEFDCSDRGDGIFSNPKEKCSYTYYACSGGLAQKLTCPAGLVFDPEKTVCNVLDQTFACTGVRVTTLATEPPPITYAPPKHPIDCHDMKDGPHPDPTERCSRVFYMCSNERTTMETCAGNTFFNTERKLCDEWVNIFDCSGQPPPTPADVPATIPPKPVNFECSKLHDGSYPDPMNKCSKIYYVCFHGIANELSCPSTTYWDPDEQVCDGYSNIFACTGMKKVPTTEPATTELITSPPRIPEYPCIERDDGFYPDPANKCSNMYFVCSKKVDNKLYCPSGLYFDVETKMCDRWVNVYACSGSRPAPTTQAPKKDTVTEKVPFDCHGLADGDYADPTKTCSHIYYSCSGGVATKRECTDSTYFDQEINLCETFDNVPECSGTHRKMTTPSPPRDIPVYPFKCEHQPDGNYPAGDCEDHYWSCVAGVTSKIDCPLGLKYDIEMTHCEWDDHIPKCGGRRVTYPPLDANPQPHYPLDCEKLNDGLFPDPESECSQTFYVCLAGRTTKLDCPAGLFYNHDEVRCDLKVNVSSCGGSAPKRPHDAPSSYNKVAPPTLPQKVQSAYNQVTTNEQQTLAVEHPVERSTIGQPVDHRVFPPHALPPHDQPSEGTTPVMEEPNETPSKPFSLKNLYSS